MSTRGVQPLRPWCPFPRPGDPGVRREKEGSNDRKNTARASEAAGENESKRTMGNGNSQTRVSRGKPSELGQQCAGITLADVPNARKHHHTPVGATVGQSNHLRSYAKPGQPRDRAVLWCGQIRIDVPRKILGRDRFWNGLSRIPVQMLYGYLP